jgi:hypothetical protein
MSNAKHTNTCGHTAVLPCAVLCCVQECHLAGGKLVVGPPPKKDRKPKQTPEDSTAEQPSEEAAVAAGGGSSNGGSKQPQQKQQQQRGQAGEPQAAAAPRVSKPTSEDGITFDAEAAAFELGEADSSDDVIDESGVFLLDEADDVEVDGDEPLEQFQARLRKSIEQELADIQAERKALKQQQQQRRDAADASADAEADAAGARRRSGDGSRQVRTKRVPALGGSPQEAAALAMAAIEADEAAAKARKRLPAALLAARSSGGRRGGGSGGGGRGGRKLRGSTRTPGGN